MENTNTTFKVVRILDEYRIIINAGTIHGIDEHSRFKIMGVVDKVYDPDTQELLGTLNGEKARVIPIEIYEKMCICENSNQIIPMQTFLLGLSSPFSPLRKKLPIDKSQIANPETYSEIVPGDRAELYSVILEDSSLETEDSYTE